MFFYSFKFQDPIQQNVLSLASRISLEPLSESSHTENNQRIYICSKANIKCNQEYIPLFLRVNSNTRKRILNKVNPQSFFDNKAWGDVLNGYIEELDKLDNIFPDFATALNLSFGDYCILIPAKISSINLQSLNQTLKTLDLIYYIPESYADQIKAKMLEIFNNQHVYKYLPRVFDCQQLITDLLSARVDTQDRTLECAALTGILLSYFLDTLNIYAFQKNGDYRYISSDMIENLDASTNQLIHRVNTFLRQVQEDSIHEDCVWSFLFLSKALLSASLESYADKKLNDFNRYKFSGFIPLVSPNTEAIGSSVPDIFVPQRTFAFLQLPNNLDGNLISRLPGMLHELAHYIPHDTRREHDIIVRLAFQSTINPLINALTKECNTSKGKIDMLLQSLYESYQSILYLNTLDVNDEYPEDSIFFLSKNSELFAFFDFHHFYDNIPHIIDMTHEERKAHSKYQKECAERWDKFGKSYLRTFAMAFREIHADIAMCTMLGLTLKEYIEILASEPTWADYNANQTADSSIIRFGFMTRYHFIKENQDAKFNSSQHFNDKYINEMTTICENLKNEHPNLTSHIDNILSYVTEYFNMMIESEPGYYTSQHNSAFEDAIFPLLQITDTPSARSSVVELWSQECKKYETQLFADIMEIYRQYCYYIDNFKYQEAMQLNYQFRLVCRDLTLYTRNILE